MTWENQAATVQLKNFKVNKFNSKNPSRSMTNFPVPHFIG